METINQAGKVVLVPPLLKFHLMPPFFHAGGTTEGEKGTWKMSNPLRPKIVPRLWGRCGHTT
jgi:hypothetical protein